MYQWGEHQEGQHTSGGDIKHEGYPKGWTLVVLMVSPDGNEYCAIGGDQPPGDGDRIFFGYEHIRKLHVRIKALSDALRDAVSIYGPKESVLVTEERQETWKSVLEKYGCPRTT